MDIGKAHRDEHMTNDATKMHIAIRDHDLEIP
jgi:hypothetical protein